MTIQRELVALVTAGWLAAACFLAGCPAPRNENPLPPDPAPAGHPADASSPPALDAASTDVGAPAPPDAAPDATRPADTATLSPPDAAPPPPDAATPDTATPDSAPPEPPPTVAMVAAGNAPARLP